MKDDNISDFLPLTNLTAQDFDKTIAKLDEFWKAKSIAILDKLGFHVLPGAAILAWNEKISLKLLNYCKENNWTSVTIRTDKAKETGENIPRGGYQVQINKLETEIKKHLRNGRIVIVHEPRDRYKNLYGINVLYDNKIPTELYFEVVGHGFEVSNLNRGDIQPHEKLVIRKKNDEFVILKRDIISNSEYKNSVNLRYQQIGISLMDQTVESSMSKKNLQNYGRAFLKKHGYALLNSTYEKIPLNYIKQISHSVIRLPYKMSKLGITIDQLVLSITVFDSEQLVYWDMVLPKHKYEGIKVD